MTLARIGRVARSLLTLNRDREYAMLKRFLALKPRDRLLDVGSGDGFWTARFASHCDQIVGLDPDEGLQTLARRFHSRPNLLYVRGFAERLPFPDASFDKVTSVSCLEHFADPMQGLREMARVLRLGGRLAVSVDSLLPENSESSFREWHKRRYFVTEYFSHAKLMEMIARAGLRSEPERSVHLFRSRMAVASRRVFVRNTRLTLPLFPLLYGIARLGDRITQDMHGQIIIVTATR